MQRHGINQIGTDLVFCEMLTERVTARMPNRKLVKNRFAVGGLRREMRIGKLDPGEVACGDRLAAGRPSREVRQLHVE